MSTFKRVVSTIGLAATLACAQRPPASTQEDVQAITRTNQEWTASIKAGNVDQMVAPLTADAVLLPPNEPAAVGLEAVRAWSQRMVDQVTFTEGTSVRDEVVVVGDWAFTRGTFHGTFQPKAGGAAVSDVTKYMLIWRRQPDGSWRISRDIWNSNNPAPSAR
ncbi:MAG: nuclear transport factor 2 family protein [Gemmatimonadetes bacterium]|nr:nuclear transport factor 2 family protein [Gemmatimonadota bacterium]